MAHTQTHRILGTLDRLERLRQDGNTHGHRAFERYVIRGDAELTPADPYLVDQPPVAASLRDVSLGGLGLITQLPLDLDTMWRVSFLSHELCIGQQAMVVRHCHRVESNLYLVGGQFCVEPGLMMLLGVEPGRLRSGAIQRERDEDESSFVPPGEVA